MMMKSKKTNKKLALMVGMALSFGVAYGMAPSDAAFAATYNVSYNAESSEWSATTTDGRMEVTDANSALALVEESAEEANTITFDSWTTYKKLFNENTPSEKILKKDLQNIQIISGF